MGPCSTSRWAEGLTSGSWTRPAPWWTRCRETGCLAPCAAWWWRWQGDVAAVAAAGIARRWHGGSGELLAICGRTAGGATCVARGVVETGPVADGSGDSKAPLVRPAEPTTATTVQPDPVRQLNPISTSRHQRHPPARRRNRPGPGEDAPVRCRGGSALLHRSSSGGSEPPDRQVAGGWAAATVRWRIGIET